MKLSRKTSVSVALLSVISSSSTGPRLGEAFSASSIITSRAALAFSASVTRRTNIFRTDNDAGTRSQRHRVASRTAPLHAASSDGGSGNSDKPTDDSEGEKPSWWLTPNLQSPRRRARLAKEDEIRSRFVTHPGELRDLREDTASLKDNLKWAEATGDVVKIADLRDAIRRAEDRDAELVYARSIELIKQAEKLPRADKKRKELVAKYTEEAKVARSCIPRFNLEGLWIGNYGKNGAEMVNVTYTGDTLVATKVTGDKHVPRGKISFKSNFAPRDENNSPPLSPIELSQTAASKWGVDKLQRYPGEGRIATEGFTDAKYVDGQLIMFEDYFSFMWIPTKKHVFFSRPSPQLTIHMLRDIISEEDEVDNMRDHIARCFDMDTPNIVKNTKEGREEHDPFRRILREDDLASYLEEREENKQKSRHPKFAFWKWKGYIDEVLGDNKE